MKYKKVGIISLGCGKNLINSEQMLYLIKDAGYEIVPEPTDAQVVIVNTCGFIDSAKSEAIETILSLADFKKAGGIEKILVAGCLSERYKEQVIEEMPEVDGIIGCGAFGEVISAINAVERGEIPVLMGDIDAPVEETERILTGFGSWSYVKIAEGCDNKCAYCVIPSLRGKFRSRPMENILEEVEQLARGGIREFIIVAQDITRYGTDLYGRRRLSDLLKEMCTINDVEWIRLHYLYPDEIDDELIKTIASEEKILKYLDIPIQHINDNVLKRMNRRGTGDEIRALISELRRKIPGLVLRTSLIVGLPGEEQIEFGELCEFLRWAKIERTGVFSFSPEEGTKAAEMPDRADEETAQTRVRIVEEIQSRIMDEFNSKRLGTIIRVICEGYDEENGYYYGRSYAESPEIDGVIYIKGKQLIIGEFSNVLITEEQSGGLIGEAV